MTIIPVPDLVIAKPPTQKNGIRKTKKNQRMPPDEKIPMMAKMEGIRRNIRPNQNKDVGPVDHAPGQGRHGLLGRHWPCQKDEKQTDQTGGWVHRRKQESQRIILRFDGKYRQKRAAKGIVTFRPGRPSSFATSMTK